MSIEIKLRKGEPMDRAIRRLKKSLDREGVIRDVRAKRYFEKPSDSLIYSRAMGRCEQFSQLTEVMSGIKQEVQERILKETEDNNQNVLNGAQGANAILEELKES